jgi:hypothetical protein
VRLSGSFSARSNGIGHVPVEAPTVAAICTPFESKERNLATMTQRRGRRLTSVIGVTALAAALVPGVAAADSHDVPAARGIDRVCPAPEDATVDAPALTDVTGVHAAAIDCALDYGLVRGFNDATYRPGVPVTRAQMATFVAGWIETALGEELEVPATDPFPDIAGTHRDSIAALAAAGVVSGRTDGTFGSGAAINRGQMARFMTNAIDYADNPDVEGTLPDADDTVYFADAAGTFFQADIQAIAGVGIVQGDAAGNYNPGGSVTRGQLGSFMMRGADYLDREQRWLPTAVEVTYEVALSFENEVSVDEDTGEVTFGVGQPDATGTANLVINAFDGTLDYTVDYTDVDGPFAEGPGLHIHVGELDENGPIVVDLASGPDLQAEADQIISGNVAEADAEIRYADLIEFPEAFYVNLHTDAQPAGAVRGQLPDGGQDLIPSVVDFEATLTGEAEITTDDDTGAVIDTGVGELGATAEAFVRVDALRGVIDYEIDFSDVTGPFAEAPGFHIHVGNENENGPIVVFLADGAEVAAAEDEVLSGTFTEDDLPEDSTFTFRELLDDPEGYYLNLHSEGFPAGAVRAQLG